MIPELEVLDFYDFLYDYISPGIRSGTYTIIKNTMISPIRYGITDLEIRSIGSPVIPEATNRLMATGGVIIPMAIPTTNRIPKCTVLIPMALTSGRNTGERMMIAEEVSMKTPASRMISRFAGSSCKTRISPFLNRFSRMFSSPNMFSISSRETFLNRGVLVNAE